MSKTEELVVYLEGLAEEIEDTHWTDNIYSSAAELRRLSQVERELLALRASLEKPVAWRCRVEGHPWWLVQECPQPKLLMETEPLYAIKEFK